MPIRRGRFRKRKRGRRVRSKRTGYNKITLPRSFPASEMHQPFTSTQSLLLAGHVNSTSHFQFFRFNMKPDGLNDFHFTAQTAGDGNGVGDRMVTHSYRNFDLLSPFYDRMMVDGAWLTLDFTQQVASTDIAVANMNIYLWMQTNDTNAADLEQPLNIASTGNTSTVAAVIDVKANTDTTLQALELSRRVQKFKSYRVGGTVKAQIRFWIPAFTTRRGYKMNVSHRSRQAGDGGNINPPTRTVGTGLGSLFGYENQVNVVVCPEFATAATAQSETFFTHLRITKSFKCVFFERNETAN